MELIRGDRLSPELRQQVLNAFIYRWTRDNPRRVEVYGNCPACDIRCPHVGKADGHNHPTIEMVTDEEWLCEHAFYVTGDGFLSAKHKHCEPAYLAEREQ